MSTPKKSRSVQPSPVKWRTLDTPQDFIKFSSEVMVPMVQKEHPAIARGFQNEILNLSVKGNKHNMLVDLFSYIEEYLCSYLETRGDFVTRDQIIEADQYMRSAIDFDC
jgi:hypothetical protein